MAGRRAGKQARQKGKQARKQGSRETAGHWRMQLRQELPRSAWNALLLTQISFSQVPFHFLSLVLCREANLTCFSLYAECQRVCPSLCGHIAWLSMRCCLQLQLCCSWTAVDQAMTHVAHSTHSISQFLPHSTSFKRDSSSHSI